MVRRAFAEYNSDSVDVVSYARGTVGQRGEVLKPSPVGCWLGFEAYPGSLLRHTRSKVYSSRRMTPKRTYVAL